MSDIIKEGLEIADKLNNEPRLAAEVGNHLFRFTLAKLIGRFDQPDVLIQFVDLEQCREDIVQHIEGLDRPDALPWLHGFDGQTICEELEDNEEWVEWVLEWVINKGHFNGVLNAFADVTEDKKNAVAVALSEYFDQDPEFKKRCLLGDLY